MLIPFYELTKPWPQGRRTLKAKDLNGKLKSGGKKVQPAARRQMPVRQTCRVEPYQGAKCEGHDGRRVDRRQDVRYDDEQNGEATVGGDIRGCDCQGQCQSQDL